MGRRFSTPPAKASTCGSGGSDLARFAAEIGFSAPRKQAALATLLAESGRYATKPHVTLASREIDGQEAVYNLSEPLHHSYIVDGGSSRTARSTCTSTIRPATSRR